MTKHDTWVTLKPGNPLSEIMHLFPDGLIPMRDPFPLIKESLNLTEEDLVQFLINAFTRAASARVEELSPTELEELIQGLIDQTCEVEIFYPKPPDESV